MDIDMVYRAMLRQELARPDFSRKYEYLKYRRILVDWMSEVGEEMQVRKETVHTAIAYLERVLAVRFYHLFLLFLYYCIIMGTTCSPRWILFT